MQNHIIKGLIASCLLVVTFTVNAAEISKAKLDNLKSHFQTYVDTNQLTGLTTFVSHHGKPIHFETYGLQDKDKAVPMAKDSIFRIYSMTKPITGVAMMMLWEEGHFKLDDPVAKYIPAFKDTRVFTSLNEDGTMITEPQKRQMTIRDLMRHTSGLTYGLFGNTPVDKAYMKVDILNADVTLKGMVEKTAKLPLVAHPGEKWNYSVSTDVQGHLIEIFSGMPLDDFFKARIFKPLGMTDTGFYVPAEKADRLVEIYKYDKNKKLTIAPIRDYTQNPAFKSGGGGLVSTTMDYWYFCQMLLNGGSFNGHQIIKSTTVDMMRTNQLPENIKSVDKGGEMGFGLNFAVKQNLPDGSPRGNNGEYNWGGLANTKFWIDPKEELVVILMTNIMPPNVPPIREELYGLIYPISDRNSAR